MGKHFDDLDRQIQEQLVDNYKGETDIEKVLDLSRFKDDIDGLMNEMLKQPSIYAYWANLRRIAEENYDKVNSRFEIIKSRKRKEAIEKLSFEGNNKPNIKSIENKLNEMIHDDETFQKFHKAVAIWLKRKEQLTIIERSVSARDASFRSLSYLLGNMMKNGIYVYDAKHKSKLSHIKE